MTTTQYQVTERRITEEFVRQATAPAGLSPAVLRIVRLLPPPDSH
jgi:hypothetical protein